MGRRPRQTVLPLPFQERVRVALPCYIPISLTPRFSEVHGRVYYHNRFSGLLVQ